MCDFNSEDRASFWRVEKRKARTARRCHCCGRTIAKGESYSNTFAIQDGLATSEAACAACAEDIEKFGEAHRFFPFPSSFEPYLSECVVGDDAGSKWRPMLEALHGRQVEAEVRP